MAAKFTYDREKATHVVRWLLARHGQKLDRMKLLKLVFLADREHLSRFARPIIGGQYCAMPHGPVLSELYDDIKKNALVGVTTIEASPAITTQSAHDEDQMSESDLNSLTDVDEKYGRMDGYRLRDLTHGFIAWTRNRPSGGINSKPIPYEDFFLDMPERADILELIQQDEETRAYLELLGND